MIEILNPRWDDLRLVFEREFQGMVVDATAEAIRSAARFDKVNGISEGE